jgi:hypothetical protein
MDNARPHNAGRPTECLQAQKIQRIPHPAYSPDLTPSDFFLFGYIKQKLTEYDIPDRKNLKSGITYIFHEIGQETLMTVLETWTNRLEWVSGYKVEINHLVSRQEEIGRSGDLKIL